MEGIEFAIERLAIKIYTNIPEKQYQIVDFTRDMLYIPKDNSNENENETEQVILSQLPFFTVDIEYPKDVLSRLYYQERINFFFNAETFEDILRPYYNKDEQPINDEENNDEGNNSYYDNRERRTRKNIMTMLEILFPTKFPVINDVDTSYDYLKGKHSTRPLWFNPFRTHYFSYLKIGTKTYTIKKTIWLNDMLNHPFYRKMIVEYRKIRKWADEQLYSTSSKYNKPDAQISELQTKMNGLFDKIKAHINELKESHGQTAPTYTNDFNQLNAKYNSNYENIDDKLTAVLSEDWLNTGTQFIRNKQVDEPQNKIINSMKSAKTEIIALNEQIVKIKEKVARIENYFKKSLNTITSGANVPVEMRKYQAVMNTYSEPFRKTSNIYLQKLIDDVLKSTTNNDGNRFKFYQLLDIIYNKYIEDESISAAETKILNDNTAAEPKLVNVGISYINLNDSNKPTREVYFMIDLIDGEINNENMSSIYCPYIGDHLGNQLSYLLIDARKPIKNHWAVDKNRQMFSLKNANASVMNNFSSLQLESKPNDPSKQTGRLQLENNQSKQTNIDASLKTNFMSRILTNPGELQELIDSLKKKYIMSNDILSLNATNILDNIKDMNKNPFAQELYNVIELWNKDMEMQNPDVIKKLIKIQSGIAGQTEIINREKESYATKNDPTGQTKLLLSKENDVNELLKAITTKVLKHESENKREKISGGTKKHKYMIKPTHKRTKKKH